MSEYTPLIELLDRALASQAGLSIETEDSDALRRRLYVAMRLVREGKAPDSGRFSDLHLRISPGSTRILEIHKKRMSDLQKSPHETAEDG